MFVQLVFITQEMELNKSTLASLFNMLRRVLKIVLKTHFLERKDLRAFEMI